MNFPSVDMLRLPLLRHPMLRFCTDAMQCQDNPLVRQLRPCLMLTKRLSYQFEDLRPKYSYDKIPQAISDISSVMFERDF